MANSSFYSTGVGGKKSSKSPDREFEEPVDKDPVYRTNDTFKRAYKKNIVVKDGENNQTDCFSTIWVKFADPLDQMVVEDLGEDRGRNRYRLACGHQWEGRLGVTVGAQHLSCMKCGQEQSYLGFEHEWQHVLFKTDPKMAKLFITPWAMQLRERAPHVGQDELEKFLFLVLNAFDDIRCNSLWELLYAGSADRIWQRWTRISNSRGALENSENFIGFLFAIALGTPTLPDGPFEEMRPMIEWGMTHIRYKGYQRALVVARMAMEHCLDKLLAALHPPPSSQQDQQQQSGEQNAQDSKPGKGAAAGNDQHDGATPGLHAGDGGPGGQPSPTNDGGGVPNGAAGPTQPAQPQEPGLRPDSDQASDALSSLLQNAGNFDSSETHLLPDRIDPYSVSDAVRAAVAKALTTNIEGPALDPDRVDTDMQTAIDNFRDGMTHLSPDSQLMADAKASILFIDVFPDGIKEKVELSRKDLDAMERTRGVFFRTLGKQRLHKAASGLSIDIDAAIQYSIEPNDSEIFEQEKSNQGFAYMTLCDMSGSMNGERFGQVTRAAEMLKGALRFPFVDGRLWGFRGGEMTKAGVAGSQCWVYRYNRECDGYVGLGQSERGVPYPVTCGGLTPMHSAIRVATRFMLSQVSPGMAKHIFLLTDGAPCGRKVSGDALPGYVLQQFVGKEIQWARQRGIQVYALIIDGGISDHESRVMFGPPRFWKSVSSKSNENSVDRVLQSLVIQNFEKYLRSRG